MNDKPIIPEVEIIEDGKPVPPKTIDPSVIQFIMTAAQTAQLVRLRKLEESKVPIGIKSYKWTVTNTVSEIDLGQPWISFSLINDGAGSVCVRVNNQEGPLKDEAEINSGESYDIDFDYPIITKILLVTKVAGTTATVRVYAEEGKW